MSPKIAAMLEAARRKELGLDPPEAVPKPPPRQTVLAVPVSEEVAAAMKANPDQVGVNIHARSAEGKVVRQSSVGPVRHREPYEPTPEQIVRAESKARGRLNRSLVVGTGPRRLVEEMYWAEVDRLMAEGPSPVAMVVSAYDPIRRFEREFD